MKSVSRENFRQPGRRASSTFELILTDLAGPIEPADINGHRYAITFTGDFSGAILAYFFRNKGRHCICHKEIYR